jgi:UrcA family protein
VNKSTILLVGLAALCAVPAAAETISVPVSFAGLDLTSSNGQDTLNHRVQAAVRTICGTPDIRDLPAVNATRHCTIAALDQAHSRVQMAIAASQPNVRIATAR